MNAFADSIVEMQQGLGKAPAGKVGVELTARRERGIAAFRRFGLPHRKLENWHFTGLAALDRAGWHLAQRDAAPAMPRLLPGESWRLAFSGGRLALSQSALTNLPSGLRIRALSAALAEEGESLLNDLRPATNDAAAALAALNDALLSDGWLIELEPGLKLDRPLHLAFENGSGIANLTGLVRLGAGAEATLVESWSGRGAGWSNAVQHIMLDEGAAMQHVRLQLEDSEATHTSLTQLVLERSARYHHFSLMQGGRIARHELALELSGEGAVAELSGLLLAKAQAHLDQTLRLAHEAPGCISRQDFRNIVDERGQGVFQGRIRVAPGAQKTAAEQLCRSLLLSDHAAIDTKPELEILADDVTCSHGATVGDLDPASLFYLRARGIGEAEARRLLLMGFAEEALEAIADTALRGHVEAEVLRWLGASPEEIAA